jgi:hypothetical protein
MATDTRTQLEDILNHIMALDGWSVTKAAKGMKITNPEGRSINVHVTLRDNRSLLNTIARLKKHGYDPLKQRSDKILDRARRSALAEESYRRINDRVMGLAARQIADEGLTPGQVLHASNSSKVTVELIDAKMAADMLARHEEACELLALLSDEDIKYLQSQRKPGAKLYIRNRTLRKDDIRDLAILMLNGDWYVTHQGIAISRGYTLEDGEVVGEGFIIDGQHRLHAVMAARRVPMAIYVHHDQDPDTFVAVDTGSKRMHKDNVHASSKYSKAVSQRISATGRLLWFLLQSPGIIHFDKVGRSPSHGDLDRVTDLVFGHADYEEMSDLINIAYKTTKLNRSSLGSLYLLGKIDWPEAPIADFYQRLHKGVDPEQYPAVHALRDWAIFRNLRSRNPYPVSVSIVDLHVLIRAYNADLRGKTNRPGFRKDLELPAPFRPKSPSRQTMQEFIEARIDTSPLFNSKGNHIIDTEE